MHELRRGGRPVAVSRALPVQSTAVVVGDVNMGAFVHATMASLCIEALRYAHTRVQAWSRQVNEAHLQMQKFMADA